MQLKRDKKSIRKALGVASCALLQLPAGGAAQEWQQNRQSSTDKAWDIQSGLLIYSEGDSRVSLVEPVVKGTRKLGDDEYLRAQVVFDTLTGASPNGAQASAQAQTFTSPSGKSSYTTPAKEIPLDSTFSDNRLALNAEWERARSEESRLTLGGNFSVESDYRSLGASANYARDFNSRNTTLAAGISFSSDSIGAEHTPIPVPLSRMSAPVATQGEGEESGENKTVFDLLLGVTQVIDRKTLTQLNFTTGYSSGYHNDPYKIISEVDPNTGIPTGDYYYEKRPDSRLRNAVYWKLVRHLSEDVIHFSYRYYSDDWQISSHTVDLRYRWELGGGHYLQPHLRYYTQSAADFYDHSLYVGASPQFISADYRLAAFDSTTVGLKYGQQISASQGFSIRVELMQQKGDSYPTDAVGEQKQFDLFPDTSALILQANYSFIW